MTEDSGPRDTTRHRHRGQSSPVSVLAATMSRVFAKADSSHLPSSAILAGLSVPERIVAIANSQIGYRTDPDNSPCNKVQRLLQRRHGGRCERGDVRGVVGRLRGLVWQKAGVQLTYAYSPCVDRLALAITHEGVANA